MSITPSNEALPPQQTADSFEILVATEANQGLEHTGEVRELTRQIETIMSKYGEPATDPQDDEAKYRQTPFLEVPYGKPSGGKKRSQDTLRIAYRERISNDSFDQDPITYSIILESANGQVLPFANIVGSSLSLVGFDEKNIPEQIHKVGKLVDEYDALLKEEHSKVQILGHRFPRRHLILGALLIPAGVLVFKGCEGFNQMANSETQTVIDFDARNTRLGNAIELRTSSSVNLTETKGLKDRLDVAQDAVPTISAVNAVVSDLNQIIQPNIRKLSTGSIRQVIFVRTTSQHYPSSTDTSTVANIELQTPITSETAYLRVWTDAVDDGGNSVADKLRVAFTSNSVRVAWEGGDIGTNKPRVLLQVIDQ